MPDRDRLFGNLIHLCRIPSPSGDVGRLRDRIRAILTGLGYSSRTDEHGNLFTATEPTGHEAIFLSCHMDTVPVEGRSEINVIRENGRISSDGTTILGGDDKQGVAAAIEMLALCREHPGEHRGLEVVFTVDEEIGARGASMLDHRRLAARQGFNLDGETPPGTVINQAPRKERFHCRVRGKSAHAALAPEEGINALVIAGDILTRLPLGTPGRQSTAGVGIFNGGTQTNIIPDSAEFTGELRSFSREEFDEIRAEINRVCTSTAARRGGSAEVEWEYLYDGYRVAEDSQCSEMFARACRRRGIEPEFRSSRGGGDSNALNAAGLTNLVFGLGMHHIHEPHEYVMEREYFEAVSILTEIVFPQD